MAITSPTDHETTQAPRRGFLGHPWQLLNLVGLEMWERFSFYGLQGILAYYLYYSVSEGGLGLDQGAALSVVGAYGGLVYLSSIIGAWVADRILSAERTLLYSAIGVMVGHLTLALLPNLTGVIIGLVCIALGSGTLKTTSQSILGSLYRRGDSRRDGGFSIYYIGVNIGGFLGPLLTGWLWKEQGFHWGFGAAAVLMTIGLAQYLSMRASVVEAEGQEVPNPLPAAERGRWLLGLIVGAVALAALFGFGIVNLDSLSNFTSLVIIVVTVVLWLQMYRSPLVAAVERRRLVGFIPMFAASVLFFGIFQQQFTVLAVYSDQRLNRDFLGLELSPGMIQSINPLMIILFAGIFAAAWTKLGRHNPSYPVKFSLSILILGASLLIFLPFAGGGANTTPFLVICAILLLFTFSELLLSPIGNSLATLVATAAFPTRMFALWMLSMALGTALSGSVGKLYNPDDAGAERTYFIALAVACVVVSAAVFLLRHWIDRRLTAGIAADGTAADGTAADGIAAEQASAT